MPFDALMQEVLSRSILSRGLEPEALRSLAEAGSHVTLAPGEEAATQDVILGCVYLVLEGEADVFIRRVDGDVDQVGEVGPAELIGEIEIATGIGSVATVRARTALSLLRMSREAFVPAVMENPPARASVGDLIVRRLRRNAVASLVHFILGKADLEATEDFEREFEWVEVRGGQPIISLGQRVDGMYAVVDERLTETVERADGARVRNLGPGAIFGEDALFSEAPSNSSIAAKRDGVLVKLSRDACFRLLGKYPHLAAAIVQKMGHRVIEIEQGTTRWPPHVALVLAVVPARGATVRTRDFAARLARALETYGSVFCADRHDIDEALSASGIADVSPDSAEGRALGVYLSRRDKRHSVMILVADETLTPWTRRCIRQADHVVTVASFDGNTAPSEVERELSVEGRRWSLVLLHDRDVQPENTRRWLHGRSLEMHHHARMDRDEDVARIGRFLSGRAVGLVLGGGAARGFAHIGVLSALEQLRVPVDILAGTSAGATIAGAYAAGWSTDKLLEKMPRAWQRAFSLLGIRVPVLGLLSAKQYETEVARAVGAIDIEDMWRPFFSVASNLATARPHVFRSGPAAEGIGASGRVPGVVPPLFLNEGPLVDGGLLANVPVDLMREVTGGCRMIAVDVVGSFSRRASLARLNIFTVLERVAVLSSVRAAAEMEAAPDVELYLRPPVDDVSLISFDHETAHRAADRARAYALPLLRQWQATARHDVSYVR